MRFHLSRIAALPLFIIALGATTMVSTAQVSDSHTPSVQSPEGIDQATKIPSCPETCSVTDIPAGHEENCYRAKCDKTTGQCVVRPITVDLPARESPHTCTGIPQRCVDGKIESYPQLATSSSREGEVCDVLSNGEPLRTGTCDPAPQCVNGQCVQGPPRLNCTEQTCNLYRLDTTLKFIGRDDSIAGSPGGAFSESGRPDHDPVLYNNTGLSCLNSLFNTARDYADNWISGGNKQNIDFRNQHNSHYWDDRFGYNLMWSSLHYDWWKDCAEEDKHRVYVPGENHYDWVDKVCKKTTTFFDKDCRRIEKPESVNAEDCKAAAVLIYLSSPISLEWDGTEKVGGTVSVVSFPLHPSEVGASWIWKASDKLPLLVYDPEHKGEITSAQQLFGNWTFGGQRVASAQANDASAQPRPWKHGYEALQTLDADGDGKIAGPELSDLALWFDRDRDGVSQPAEVVRADASGLKEVYFQSPKTNPTTKDVELAVGFKRVDNKGQEYVGRSVDWYSDRAHNPGELFMRNVNPDFNQVGSSLPSLPPKKTEHEPSSSKKQESYGHIAGAWEWNFSGDYLDKGQKVGYLVFSQYDDGRVLGRSIVHAPIVGNTEVASMVYTALIEGKFVGKDSFSFNVASGAGVIESEVKLNHDGSRLVGKTEFTSKADKKVIYKWTAKRVSFPSRP